MGNTSGCHMTLEETEYMQSLEDSPGITISPVKHRKRANLDVAAKCTTAPSASGSTFAEQQKGPQCCGGMGNLRADGPSAT